MYHPLFHALLMYVHHLERTCHVSQLWNGFSRISEPAVWKKERVFSGGEDCAGSESHRSVTALSRGDAKVSLSTNFMGVIDSKTDSTFVLMFSTASDTMEQGE
jgi:hypothetical protein